ncbi:MAG: cobalamin synthesis protein P47K [Prevotellaceae bacterium]|jgi:G3E family GTPase|nr:cobalamin synthesis protein P47K [Prevotellaceae bacterium]
MNRTKIIVAGGFLGAGKTTLLWKSAQKLIEKGLSVALITNDQAAELVDSKFLSLNKLRVAEVSGSCFCCNFNGFTAAIKKICSETATDIILAEPVGSCVDLSATIIQPLKQYLNSELQVAPISVLADPILLKSILAGKNAGLHPDAAYICRKQFEESDIILINKSDLLTGEQLEELKLQTIRAFPFATVLTASAEKETGIDEWLKHATTGNEAGKRIADIDYDVYASGEAALGWLNGVVELHGKENTDWDIFFRNLMEKFVETLDENSLPTGHVKIIAENDKQYAIGNITGNSKTLSPNSSEDCQLPVKAFNIRGSLGKSNSIRLTVNARVETTPKELDKTVHYVIVSLCDEKYDAKITAWQCLQPGRPLPTFRFTGPAKI